MALNISQKTVLPLVKCVTIVQKKDITQDCVMVKAQGIVKKVAELEYEDYDFDGVDTQHRDQSYDSNWYGYDDW